MTPEVTYRLEIGLDGGSMPWYMHPESFQTATHARDYAFGLLSDGIGHDFGGKVTMVKVYREHDKKLVFTCMNRPAI